MWNIQDYILCIIHIWGLMYIIWNVCTRSIEEENLCTLLYDFLFVVGYILIYPKFLADGISGNKRRSHENLMKHLPNKIFHACILKCNAICSHVLVNVSRYFVIELPLPEWFSQKTCWLVSVSVCLLYLRTWQLTSSVFITFSNFHCNYIFHSKLYYKLRCFSVKLEGFLNHY